MDRVWGLNLDHASKLILMALSSHAHNDGTSAYPSVALLAWKTGYSDRQIQRTLRGLERLGIIEPIANQRGGRSSIEYYIHIEMGEQRPPFKPAKRPTSADGRSEKLSPIQSENGFVDVTPGVTFTTKGVTSTPSRGDAVPPEPSVTGSKERSNEQIPCESGFSPEKPAQVRHFEKRE